MTTNYFENQETIAKNLILFMREKGYSRLSFSKLTGISRPEIDPLLSGESNNTSSYNSYIMLINQKFQLSEDYFLRTKMDSIPPTSSAHTGRSPEIQILHDELNNMMEIYSMYIK